MEWQTARAANQKEFRALYNQRWLIERLGFEPPVQARRRLATGRLSMVGLICPRNQGRYRPRETVTPHPAVKQHERKALTTIVLWTSRLSWEKDCGVDKRILGWRLQRS